MKKSFTLFILLGLFLFSACKNQFQNTQDNQNENQNSPEKAFISFTVKMNSEGRSTINPLDVSEQDIKKVVFTMENTSVTPPASEEETFDSIEDFCDAIFSVELAKYNFYLNLCTGDSEDDERVVQSGKIENVEVVQGVNESLEFNTKYVSNGDLSVTFRYKVDNDEGNRIGFVKMGLFDSADFKNAVEGCEMKAYDCTKEAAVSEEPTQESYYYATFNAKDIANGNYYLKIQTFDTDEDSMDSTRLMNTFTELVKVYGYKTIGKVEPQAYNKNFFIEYCDMGGKIVNYEKFVKRHNQYTKVTLPDGSAISREGFTFGGWYESEYYDSAKLTTLTEAGGTLTKDLTLYAKWIIADPTLYVSASGNDANDGTSSESPVKTIQAAGNLIKFYGGEDSEWTIYVDGVITGPAQGSGDTYGRSVISEEIRAQNAKSILLTGKNGLDGQGVPQDIINRGKNNYPNPVYNGSVLEVDTSVPVTITNLILTGGKATYGSGINIKKNATVKLGDGVLIIGNNGGSNSRGVVYNEGTLFVYGSAVIGNKNAATYASYSTTADTPSVGSDGKLSIGSAVEANYANSGGGIFNGSYTDSNTVSAKLYLGYSGFNKEGTKLLEEEWTGGIYFNGSNEGGALYNAKNSIVKYGSGNMEWNNAGAGAAIKNEGTFEMTGGSILNNKGQNSGGGVYNSTGIGSIFKMSGGIINQNISNYGGGVYNQGQFFMYDEAVIGDSKATEMATAGAYGNKAQMGGGIYNGASGFVYIGYEPDADLNPSESTLSGGIYYNYATASADAAGGAIYNDGGNNGGIFKLDSGTIAYNATSGDGGAIWHSQANYSAPEISGGTIENNYAAGLGGAYYASDAYYDETVSGGGTQTSLNIKGNPVIVTGSTAGENDFILYASSDRTNYYANITIAGALDKDFTLKIAPQNYHANMKLIKLASDSGTTLDAELSKFSITPQYDSELGTSIKWSLGSDGKLKKDSEEAGISFVLEQDIVVQVTVAGAAYTYSGSGAIPVAAAENAVKFTAEEGCTSYLWSIDGVEQNVTGNSLTINTDNAQVFVKNGIYDITLEVVKGNNHYSFAAQIKVQE